VAKSYTLPFFFSFAELLIDWSIIAEVMPVTLANLRLATENSAAQLCSHQGLRKFVLVRPSMG
jgi:hypothetical protein